MTYDRAWFPLLKSRHRAYRRCFLAWQFTGRWAGRRWETRA